MSGDLLQTKLYVPRLRPFLVPRHHLIEKLNQGLQQGCKLTLISAPAGFGKTTLVSEWVNQNQKAEDREQKNGQGTIHPSAFHLLSSQVAWFSIDKNDNDPARFLTYFIAALNQAAGIETAVGERALKLLKSPQPPLTEAILTSLINEIAAIPESPIFILDDYHLIESSPIDEALTFFLDHLPPQSHLVIITRVDPALPLARLRARGQLLELRAADLRFTSAEAAQFLNREMELNLTAEDIAALETRTEGWIAGLQLAAHALQGSNSRQGGKDKSEFIQSFTGSHRFVVDYLIEEVLEQQSDPVQTFLLETAVLSKLTASLCNTLLDQDNGQEILEKLDQANLFIIPLDEERRWYRYHHLFADLLRQRLRQYKPDQIPILHRRASEWHEQTGFIDEAIEHALHGEYFERAATLIEDHFDNYERGDQTTLRRWLAEMPEELLFSRPRLSVLHAWNLFSFGQLDETDQSLQAAEKMLDKNTDQVLDSLQDKGQLSETHRMELVGRVAAIRSFLAAYSGNIPEIIRYAHQALEHLPEQELAWRGGVLITLGDAYANQGQMAAARKARSDALVTGTASGDPHLIILVNSRLAEILRQQGELQQVTDICERQWEIANESGISDSAVVGWLLGIWGETLAELNKLDRAIDQAKKGVKLAERGGDILHLVASNMCLIRVLFSSGDITGAEDVIRAMEKTAREFDIPLWTSRQLSAWQARIWLAQDKLEIASQWIGERELDLEADSTYLYEMEYIVLARILMAQGHFDEAVRLLQRLIESAEAGGRHSSVIELRILQALAAQSGGDTALAMSILEQALTLTEVGGFIRIFVDEGPPMARLLYEALSQGIHPDYVRRLLAAFPSSEPEQAGVVPNQGSEFEWVEPLSERELEVLQLLAEGLKNREISAKLYLSLNTIKVHNRNIFSKLGVNNRTKAIAQARALGLLKSD